MCGAGYIPKLHWTDALANSEGLFAYYRYAEASFILTCRTPDGTGSGWAGTTGLKDVTKIDAAALSEVAADKALKSRKPRAIEPGNYTVILEPRPAARLLSLMLFALNARPAEEGRSFMSGAERGTTKLGQKIFGENVTIRSDVGNPILRQTPIGPDGLASRPITWVDKGVVKNLFYDRYWAKKQNKTFTPTGPQQSLVMDGGDASIDQMVKSTKRGLLITFFWYIRPVEQMTLLNTGMTRDGMFLIENGEIAGPVQNFRWNDGPARAFNNISMLGAPCRCTSARPTISGTALVPAMKIEDFRMTSISLVASDNGGRANGITRQRSTEETVRRASRRRIGSIERAPSITRGVRFHDRPIASAPTVVTPSFRSSLLLFLWLSVRSATSVPSVRVSGAPCVPSPRGILRS